MQIITLTIDLNNPPEGFEITQSSKPSFSSNSAIQGLIYYNFSTCLTLAAPIYGYIVIDITYNGISKYSACNFSADNNSVFSVSDDPAGLDNPFIRYQFNYSELVEMNLVNNQTKTVYVILNGDKPFTDKFYINFSIGIYPGTNLSNPCTITIEYDCVPTPLYQYGDNENPMGVHVYSDYDSIISPRCTTILSSVLPIESWTTGTKVWLGTYWEYPALPYYYGYKNTFYKVGAADLNRAYGFKIKVIKVAQSYWRQKHNKPAITTVIYTEPGYFYNSGDDTVDACINVLWPDSGIISYISSDIVKPTKYRYLMGYHITSKQSSNDEFFAKWIFSENKFYPLTGFHHMRQRLLEGFALSAGYGPELAKYIAPLLAIGLSIKVAQLAASLSGEAFKRFIVKMAIAIAEWISGIAAGIAGQALGATSVITQAISHLHAVLECMGPAVNSNPYTIIIEIVILIVVILYLLFHKFKQSYYEQCKHFLCEYSTGPYVLETLSISRSLDMSQKKVGFYCDGVYFYTQPINSVTVRELSSSITLQEEAPSIKTGFEYSLQADNPPQIVDLLRMTMLSYMSGEPMEYESGSLYYNTEISEIVDVSDCGDLTIPLTITVTIPAGMIKSRISQEDADNKAADFLASQVRNAGYISQVERISDENLGIIEGYFTHQIRVEQTGTDLTAYYDNTDQLGLTIGKKLYYDDYGRINAMNGFYSVTGATIFRTFYKLLNGEVDDIYTMTNSTDLTVYGTKGNLSVDTTNLDFNSNWYLTSSSEMELNLKILSIITQKCFDPNTLYNESYLVRGYYRSGSNDYLLLYDDNYNNYNMTEGNFGFYKPIVEWMNPPIFQYYRSMSIAIDIYQICLSSSSTTYSLFGFYIKGILNSIVVPLFNQVSLTIDVYVDSLLKATYNVTTEAIKSTYVSYNDLISPSDNVTSIQIRTINSTNPIGKITYTIGSFHNCSNYTTTTTTPTPTTTTTTSSPTTTTTTTTPITTTTTTSCTRPTGLTNYSFWYMYQGQIFYDSAEKACEAYSHWGSGMFGGFTGQAKSLNIGETIFFNLLTDCSTMSDGYYIVNKNFDPAYVCYVLDGKMNIYPYNCPTTTTTTTPTPTTTTTTTTMLPFKITIDTTQPGSTGNTFVLPTTGSGYDANINWGDGGSTQNISGTPGNVSHTYSSPGTYQISITGTFPRIYFANIGDKLKLKTIDQWGGIQWSNMSHAFDGCTGMTANYTDTPNTLNVTSMAYMFSFCKNFNGKVDFNTSNVTEMQDMFYYCENFNQPVSGFTTSNVTNMGAMFYYCENFNQPVPFDCTNVTSMNSMFDYCSNFNQSISFNSSKVINMQRMFYNCSNLNSPISIDTSSLINAVLMFGYCTNFNQSVSGFTTSNITNMTGMFYFCPAFNQSVSNFNTSNVTDMRWMFMECTNFNQTLSNFDTSKVTNMDSMFFGCTNFNQSVSNFNTSNVTIMYGMFRNCSNFKQSLETFIMSGVTDVSTMLQGCDINISGTTTNYDNTLISWASQTLNTGLSFAGNSKYCDGETARNTLTGIYSWTISDGGKSC